MLHFVMCFDGHGIKQFTSNVIHVYTATYPRFLLSILIIIYCMSHTCVIPYVC